ncbi:MAG: hypothetical protein J6X34_05170, partial [Clostridia bacterium]|nr:hypothetical protein [Clostridia bacterium]
MSKKAFYDWCINQAKLAVSTAAQYEKHVDIIESVFGSLVNAYNLDHCAGIIAELEKDKAQFNKVLNAKDFFKISHLKDPVHRLADMISALSKYVEFLDDQKSVTQKPIIQKTVKTQSRISSGKPFRFPKVIGDLPDDYPEPPFINNVFYEEKICNKPNLFIRGLLRFISKEIEWIYSSLLYIYGDDLLKDVFAVDDSVYYEALKRIPIILRKGTPVKHYYCVIDLVKEAINRRDTPSDIFKKELLDLIDRNSFEMPIMGKYHSDGGQNLPEIRKNIEFEP